MYMVSNSKGRVTLHKEDNEKGRCNYERRKGYIQVYTGNGKGKTTAALGISLRAICSGKKFFRTIYKGNEI